MAKIILYLICLVGILAVDCLLCSGANKKGPFTFAKDNTIYSAPSKTTIMIERARIIKDVELTIMYRSYYKSYCYNGGALDPNTGCYNGINQYLPSYEESTAWIHEDKCYVGSDCKDCWGSESDACKNPEAASKHSVKGKELERYESNNHFAFHTCNLSWRCGIHKSTFPTFIKRHLNRWVEYTVHSNGTELQLDERDYWKFNDIVIRKTTSHEALVENVDMPCFWKHEHKELACYDEQFGNFVEFYQQTMCIGKYCYFTTQNNITRFGQEKKSDLANLKAASIEDLKQIIAEEHMLNEELRYNFGQILASYQSLRRMMQSIILSTAKVDDRLIGNILGQPARSHFVSDSTFHLSPCSDPAASAQNCANGLIFKDGRWTKLTGSAECQNITGVRPLDLFEKIELWFPDGKDFSPVGVAEDMEGWSFVAHEKTNLRAAMDWVQRGQRGTSMADVFS